MQGVVEYESTRSIWRIDFDSMIVTRLPRNESPGHELIPYESVGKPQEFTDFEVLNNDRGTYYRLNTVNEGWIITGFPALTY